MRPDNRVIGAHSFRGLPKRGLHTRDGNLVVYVLNPFDRTNRSFNLRFHCIAFYSSNQGSLAIKDCDRNAQRRQVRIVQEFLVYSYLDR